MGSYTVFFIEYVKKSIKPQNGCGWGKKILKENAAINLSVKMKKNYGRDEIFEYKYMISL